MTTEREQFQAAAMLTQLLEQRVAQVAAQRISALLKCVDVKSNNRAFWYGSDSDGYIRILQDAAYVCTGVHVIGQELDGLEFLISVENLWPPRRETQSSQLPTSGVPANVSTQPSISISVDHFLPAYTQGNVLSPEPSNVDYWYTPVAAWLIDRGDALRCLFQDNASAVHPLVVLSGYKVIG